MLGETGTCKLGSWIRFFNAVMLHERHGVSNHRQSDCVFNTLFRLISISKKTLKPPPTSLRFLSQCWPISVSPYGVTGPQCVKVCALFTAFHVLFIKKPKFTHLFVFRNDYLIINHSLWVMAHIHSRIHCLPSENSKGSPLIIILSAAKCKKPADTLQTTFLNVFSRMKFLRRLKFYHWWHVQCFGSCARASATVIENRVPSWS